MAKRTEAGVKKQIDYRVALIDRLREAGKDEQADKQQAYHDKRVALAATDIGIEAFWIPAYKLDEMDDPEVAELAESVAEELGEEVPEEIIA